MGRKWAAILAAAVMATGLMSCRSEDVPAPPEGALQQNSPLLAEQMAADRELDQFQQRRLEELRRLSAQEGAEPPAP